MKTTQEDIKVAALKKIADASTMVQHGHDVYSKNEVVELLNELTGKIFELDVEEDQKYTIEQIKEGLKSMFGDWNYDEYLSVDLSGDRQLELSFDDNLFERDVQNNIESAMEDVEI